ncbi:uncharacterized protein NESG_02078 [Nematocida ausubeli]|uniref:Uncharacterized protein n=1 Tax=Nematocida ausubeli (strain ATCC PRA-371 / ERTm2) TaxID=1913371 RepID=A0A086IZI9_NEMA1|nr:uncharacterized protein NESG_02078 [Nematocida ausubeli]KFG25307.1 hypothetical protein NESG_02078 [Nematocida ausubeli]
MFRFSLSNLYRRLTAGMIKECVINRLNGYLEGKVARLAPDQVTYNLLHGIIIAEDICLEGEYISGILGVRVEKCQIGCIILRSNWHHPDKSLELVVSDVKLKVNATECMCEYSKSCMKCLKKEEVLVAGAIKSMLTKVFSGAISSATSKMHITMESIEVQVLFSKTVAVFMKALEITKNSKEYLIKAETKSVTAAGISADKSTVTLDISPGHANISAVTGTLCIASEELSPEDVAGMLHMIKYFTETENKGESTEVQIDLAAEVTVSDIEELNETVLSCKKALLTVTKEGILKGNISLSMGHSGTEVFMCKKVKVLINHPEEIHGTKTIRMHVPSACANISMDLVEGLEKLHRRISKSFSLPAEEKERSLTCVITIGRALMNLSINHSDIGISTRKAILLLGKEEIIMWLQGKCILKNRLVATSIPQVSADITMHGKYLKEFSIETLNSAISESIAETGVVVSLCLQSIMKYVDTRIVSSEKSIRMSESLVGISKCNVSVMQGGEMCKFVATDVSVRSDAVTIDKLEVKRAEEMVLSVYPVQILLCDMPDIILTNTEIFLPHDDILEGILRDIRTIHFVMQKLSKGKLQNNNCQMVHASEKKVKNLSMRITCRNTNIQAGGRDLPVSVCASNVILHIDGPVLTASFAAGIVCKNGNLKVSCQKMLYTEDTRNLTGAISCTGSIDVDLYVFLINRVFFILNAYTIITDYPIFGVPSIPSLAYLAYNTEEEKTEKTEDAPAEAERLITAVETKSDIKTADEISKEIVIRIEADASIYLLKGTSTLCKVISKMVLQMVKGSLYTGTISITNIQAWADGALLCSVPLVSVDFAKISHIVKTVDVVVERVEASDAIGTFLDIFGLLTKVNFTAGVPSVPTHLDIKCKVSQVIVQSGRSLITVTQVALVNVYAQLYLMLHLDGEPVLESPVKVSIRNSPNEMQEIHISTGAIESTLIDQTKSKEIVDLLNRLNLSRAQKYSIPGDCITRVECPLISVKMQKPPIKTEIVQMSMEIVQLSKEPSAAVEGSAMCRIFVQLEDAPIYEVMCETFPMDISIQSQVGMEKESTGFCSLPFTEGKKEEALRVAFISFVTKDIVRIRLSKRIVEALKQTERKVSTTNLTNKIISINGTALVPLSTTVTKNKKLLITTESQEVLFETNSRQDKKAVQVSKNLFLGTFRESAVEIRGATNFKNTTDMPLFIHTKESRIVLPAFSECSDTSFLMEFQATVEDSAESVAVAFTVPENSASEGIEVIGSYRIEHNESYITVVCLFEVVSGLPIIHYFFHHDIVIQNLSLSQASFEMKISAKSSTEKIMGVARPGETKQISGKMHPERAKKVRLRINGTADLILHPNDSASKVTVSKGVLATKEAKNVVVSGQSVDIGIVQVTIYPVLIAINKTQDDLYLKSGSRLCRLLPEQQTAVVTSKDRHAIVLNRSESVGFSSKIQYNTIFLDIKTDFQMNYLMNIYQGHGAKEKIKYAVVEYASVIENKTGLSLTIVTDREFTCGLGERVPMHFPRKKLSSWIRLGDPRDDLRASPGMHTDISDYILDLEKSVDASYLPLEGLKKHFVKLNTAEKAFSTAGMLSSVITSKSSIYMSSTSSLSAIHGIPEEADPNAQATNNSILLSITIQTNNAQRVILIEKETVWPYLIKNMSQKTMQFSQKGHPIEYILQPNEVLPYYWDSFKAQPAFNVQIDGCTLEISTFSVVSSEGYKATLSSERQIKVLTVTEQTQDPGTDPSAGQGILTKIRTGRVSISLIDQNHSEFAALHLFNIHLLSLFSQNGLEFLLKLDSFQMDNQEAKGYYHIPLHTPITSDVLSVSGWIMNKMTIRYMSIVVLPVVLEIEEVYMKKVIQHFVPLDEPLENPKYFTMCSKCQLINCTCTYPIHTEPMSFYTALGYFKIEAIKFKCSFRRASHGSIVPLASVFCNITSSKVSLPSIELFDTYARTHEIFHIIGRMYKRGFIRNIVSLVLSADVVASPGELFDKLGMGVHDLIYAPYRALDNPAILSRQLLKGGKSLATNVVTGVAGFVGNIMGKFSQKLADISMDESFAEAIRETSCIYVDELELGLPGHKTHLSKAGEKFMGSVISGFKGVLHSPIQGRRSNGLSGMVQGMGKGLIGAIIKPISGAVGLMHGLSTSITGVLGNDKPLLRIQLPRAPPLDSAPTEYEVERSSYYRAYIVLVKSPGVKCEEIFLTGGICIKEYTGWYILITNTRVIFYNREEVEEIFGVAVAHEDDKNTLLTVSGIRIYLEGLRVYRELGRYSSSMVAPSSGSSLPVL